MKTLFRPRRPHLVYADSQENRFPEAIAEMAKAASLNPKDEKAQLFLGNLCLPAKDREAALAQYATMKIINRQLAEKLYQVIFNGRIVAVSSK